MERPYERPEVLATYSVEELTGEAAECFVYEPTATN